LALSILLKLWLCLFNRNLGKRINSSAMLASAADSLSDSAATAAVLIGLLAGTVTPFPVDGWIGLLVSLFIFKAGWGAAKDTIDPLLGKPADPELVSSIAATILRSYSNPISVVVNLPICIRGDLYLLATLLVCEVYCCNRYLYRRIASNIFTLILTRYKAKGCTQDHCNSKERLKKFVCHN
jgi:hypothetical protein